MLAWALWSALVGSPTDQAHAPDRLRLQWDAPLECPSIAELEAAIAELLGDASHKPIEVVARAEPHRDGTWTVELELHTPQGVGRRTVAQSRSCSEAARATAVIVAIAIAPAEQRPVEPPSVEPAPAPTPPSDDERPLESADASEAPPSPSPREPLRGLASTSVGLGSGSLPAPALGLAPELGLAGSRFRVTLGATWWFRRRVELPGSARVEFRQWTLAARAGPVFRAHPLVDLSPQVGIEVGQTLVRARGLNEGSARDPWVAALLQPTVVIAPRSLVAFRFGLELVVPILRRRYQATDFPEVFATPPVGVRGFVGLELRFPSADTARRNAVP